MLLQRLGAGGQGEVWRARDIEVGEEVALKVLRPALARSDAAWAALLREHTIANQLNHPSILKVFAPVRDDEVAALPMELATGGDLRRLRGASYLEIVPVLLELAQALQYAHKQGVVHRDLKPGNVLFDERGRVRLADFGISGTVLSSAREAARAGLSPFTASPEHLRGEPPAVSDDIYGLGALAYELLSGYPPFYPRFDVKRVQEEPVPELKPSQQAPARLLALVTAMLAKRPQRRPPSMREVIDTLEVTLNDTLTFELESASQPSALPLPETSPSAEEPPLEPAQFSDLEPAPVSARTQPSPPVADTPPPPQRPITRARELPVATASGALEPLERPPRWPPESKSRQLPRPASETERTQPTYASAPARAADDAPAPPPQRPTQRAVAASEPIVREPAPNRPAPEPPRRPAESESRQAPTASAPVLDDDAPTPAPQREAAASEPIAREQVISRQQPEPPPRGAFAPGHATAAEIAEARRLRPLWSDLRIESAPQLMRLEPRARRWPWVLVLLLALAAAASFYVLPRVTAGGWAITLPQLPPPSTPRSEPANAPAPPAAADSGAVPAQSTAPLSGEQLRAERTHFDQHLAALDARAAGVWGGQAYADAKARAAESAVAADAGDPAMATARLSEAQRLLDTVEQAAPNALATQLSAGATALAAGEAAAAREAFELASRIDPTNQRAADGMRRARALDAVLPLMADASNAEAARDFGRAARDYTRVLALDSGNTKARLGLQRANAALSEDNYAKAVGSGFAALGAGRLDDARKAFEQARSISPTGRDAVQGLERVQAALRARDFEAVRTRAAGLEAEERWEEAEQEYEAALKIDPSLSFAQEGQARAAARAQLSDNLQGFIDHPQRLAAPSARAQALELIKDAHDQQPSGPVLRSQAARLSILLPEFDKPVHLELESDNATQVAISQIGSFGTFSKRDIELKPGRYTVIGTRAGYREVRRDVTIAPGQDQQTISVRCMEPI
jgi:serine/threonine protein kinase/tetratricopeptide (TPR) repeat protein